MTDMELTPISTSGITGAITDTTATLNYNFDQLTDFVNAKADTNGSTTETFNVADATESTEAINKGQLDNAVSTINTTITGLGTTYADVSLGNINSTAKSKISRYSMPSDSVIWGIFGANGTSISTTGITYTAPANGYILAQCARTSPGGMYLMDNAGVIGYDSWYFDSSIYFELGLHHPVKAGDVVRLKAYSSTNTNNGTLISSQFRYAQSEV